MADERIVTNIVANADFSNLISDVNKVAVSLSKLQDQWDKSNKMLVSQIDKINSSFANSLIGKGQFSKYFVSLQSDVEKFGKNLDAGKLKLRQYFDAYQQHAKTTNGLIRDLAKQQVALQNAVIQPLGRNAQGLMQFNVMIPRGLDETKNKAALARQELQIMNKVIQQGANQLINWGKNTQWAGRQLTVGLTVPMAAFGKAAADAFRMADQELVRLTKVYGGLAPTSKKDLASIRKDVAQTANELAKSYGSAYTETIALAADIAATGKQGNELLASTKETTRLAVLGEVDKQTAMKATLALQSAFKQNTDQLSESINFLNAVENQTSTTLGDLIEAIPKAGPVIEGLGGSVKDLALYLTAMKEGGVNASEGANALKSALASLINPTKVATGMFASFGIDLKGIVTKNAGNLTDTLLALQSALDTLNPLQKQQALEQLFGKFQFARMNALFENLGRQGSQTLQVLDLMKASSADLANVAGRELSQITESASGRYRRALEGLKADLSGVGEQFLDINTKLITLLDKIIQFGDNLPKPVKQILALLGGVTAVIGPFIMLTGVLANFFGYIVKGISHMRAFFKGGEGWKYLTPEMLAAEKAGGLVEKTFYKDAEAAATLKTAINDLITQFSLLEQKVNTGQISAAPMLSTIAGNPLQVLPREVDPNHPLVGPAYSRASAHMVPRSSLTEQQRMNQTMFSFVPSSLPVNQKIGQNPQIYMNQALPNVPGLTTIKGVSTGIVAEEAAKWHAMNAAIASMSKQELAALKKQLATTNTVTAEFMTSFERILPEISSITQNAARDSAAIVAELRAGKMTVEQARAQIIALNMQIEQQIASTAVEIGANMGRTINPTIVPGLNQPVADVAGKSNMREMFKKGKTRSFVNKLAGLLGVRTSGAGYNIETTIPKKLSKGVVGLAGGVVGATAKVIGKAIGRRIVPVAELKRIFPARFKPALSGTEKEVKGTAGVFGGAFTNATVAERFSQILRKNKREPVVGNTITREKINAEMKYGPGVPPDVLLMSIMNGKGSRKTAADELLQSMVRAGKISPEKANELSNTIFERYAYELQKYDFVNDGNNPIWKVTNQVLRSEPAIVKEAWGRFSSMPGMLATVKGRGSSSFLNEIVLSDGTVLNLNPLRGEKGKQETFFHSAIQPPLEKILTKNKFADGVTALPGYGGGDSIPALLEPGESVVTKTATRGNQGALTLMNAGYNVDSILGLEDGEVDVQPRRGNFIRGAATSLGVGLAGQAIGSRIGGPLGTAISYGSWLLPIGGMGGGRMGGGKIAQKAAAIGEKEIFGKKIGEASFGLNKTANALTKFATEGAGAEKFIGRFALGLSRVLKLTSPLGIGITIATLAITKGISAWKDNEERLKANRLGYGLTADAAAKAGLKYTNYNEQIKNAIENAKALTEKNKLVYESVTSAGTPLNLTIEQYKKLKEQVKTTMPEFVKMFDTLKGQGQVTQFATQLKAQLMAAGDSADTATAKIYALINQSKNARLASGAIADSAFQGIRNLQDAAMQSVKTFEAAMEASDPKGQAQSLISGFQAIDASIDDTVSKSEKAAEKNKTAAITVGQAQQQQVDKLNAQYKTQTTLTRSVISEIGKINPELAKVLNSTDTITSAYAKQQLIIKGVTTDLSKLSAAGAQAALVIANNLQDVATATLKQAAGLSGKNGIFAQYDAITNKIKAMTKAAQGQSVQSQIDSRKESERLNKQIDQIKKAAAAKIDAIRKQKDAENSELEIQKKQLEAQQALASGNMSAYAQAQLDIQQLSNTREQKNAEDAINKQAELDIEPLQKQLEALQNKNQELADKASLAGEGLQKLQDKANKLKETIDGVTGAFLKILLNKALDPNYVNTEQYQQDKTALGVAAGKAGMAPVKPYQNPAAATSPEAALRQSQINANSNSPTNLADKLLGSAQSSIEKNGIVANSVNIYAGEVKKDVSNKPTGQVGPTYAGYGGYTAPGGASSWGQYGNYVNTAPGRMYGTKPNRYIYDSKSQPVYEKTDEKNFKAVAKAYNVKLARGGRIVPGIPYTINDGGKVEGIKFDMPGTVFPNVNTMSYRIPNMGSAMPRGQVSGSFNNNTYSINIELNGTNITADDVIRRMKQEMVLLNVKEGKPSKIGGQIIKGGYALA